MKMTRKYLNECFEYREGDLFWKVRPTSHFKRLRTGLMRNSRFAGRKAGTKHPDGYQQVKLDNVIYLKHRLIWVLFNGEISAEKQIDHINHHRSDNRIENLRLVTKQENLRNCAKGRNNSSGTTGVYFHRASGKWCAQINKTHLGTFTDKADAIDARKQAEVERGFHTNHGI
ncbi:MULTISPECIES: HNH endonuclease signature motif containing protein [unclassified Serratia (in: enterobacteria)]|uniref:HNH endonuclease signature motif containing protein n=1 Tax=unclassified Serratia (in: enterobacteria) TaxID=2647522 RepID=UPI00046ABDCE|nr:MULTISPECIES: HNH endonuclease signature motif containing protein [unclassified Serratia (in: enterobacteria)]